MKSYQHGCVNKTLTKTKIDMLTWEKEKPHGTSNLDEGIGNYGAMYLNNNRARSVQFLEGNFQYFFHILGLNLTL